MKPLLLFLFFCVGFPLEVRAQTPDADAATPESQPPPGTTVITSDALHMDQTTHTSLFTGNVVVTGQNFKMTCEEMTVYSTTANKIEHIVAKENVIIIQPDRITHCGQAVYTKVDDKFVLTDQPHILDNQNEISAPEIIIYRSEKKLETHGPSNVKIIEKGGSGPAASSPASTTASGAPK